MVVEVRPAPEDAVIQFGGGLNTRQSDDEINDRECSAGKNFVLDVGDLQYEGRMGFDNVATAPNGAAINGFAQLVKINGDVKTLVQAGNNLYDWDGSTGFTLVTSLNPGAKIRGTNWSLDEKVIVTDLNKTQPVSEWDGTTFQTINHNLTGDFYAKYCIVENDRAWYFNVTSGTDTPHLIVGSGSEDYDNLSVSDKPSSALGDSDPFYLTTPDLKPINGAVSAFGRIAVSTKNRGKMYKILGATAADFSIDELYSNSGATGDETLEYIGNDIVYGRGGRIESLKGTDRFGDVETDDISLKIADQLKETDRFTTVYNARLQRVYFWPKSGGTVWVFQKSLLDLGLSPWIPWQTDHSTNFEATCVQSLLDPADEQEYVYWGDASGNIYKLEGTTYQDDGTDIEVSRTSKSFSPPSNLEAYDLEAYVRFRKVAYPVSINITIEWGGNSPYDAKPSFTMKVPQDADFFSEGKYFNNGVYFGSKFRDRIIREKVSITGQSEDFRVKISWTSDKQVKINQFGIRYMEAE